MAHPWRPSAARRPDWRVLTAQMLGGLPEIERYCFFIDPFERPESRIANGRALKQAIATRESGRHASHLPGR